MNEASSMAAPAQVAPRSHENERRGALAALLGCIEPALEAAIGSESPLLTRLRVLRRRQEHECLQLAVLGQFKRGKSTFINALLGADVLPTGVIPLTAVATFIAWRREPLVVVHFRDEAANEEFVVHTADEIRNVLFRFVAEEANPENRLGVERVDLFYPADILADGTVIIDTPGVGSTLRHNTETALQVLPECDAAFFVVSADPPITEVELEYLRRLKSKTTRVFFILNKADYLRPQEQRSVVEFLQKVLSEKSLIDADGRIFCISARDGLEAKRSGNNQALETSGIAALEDHLVRMLASEKTRWLEDAVRSKAADILALASAELDLRVRALNMPIEELAAKSEAFQDALRSIEEQRRITRDLLAGDHRRLREALDYSHRPPAQGDRGEARQCHRCGPLGRGTRRVGGDGAARVIRGHAGRIRRGARTVGERFRRRCRCRPSQLPGPRQRARRPRAADCGGNLRCPVGIEYRTRGVRTRRGPLLGD